MAYRHHTTNTGSGSSISVAVPTGVQADDIVLLIIAQDTTTPTYTWPSGFTQLDQASATLNGETLAVAWKRLTGADSGTYSISGGAWTWVCHAIALSGRHTTNNPECSSDSVNNSANGPGAVTVASNGVTAVDGDDLVWVGAAEANASTAGKAWAAPSGYTEKADTENTWTSATAAIKEAASAGATGTVSGTLTYPGGVQGGWLAYLVRVPSAPTSQFGRPSADRTDGTWKRWTGTPLTEQDNVNLYSAIDETSADDTDVIRSAAGPSDDTCTLDLSAISTPAPGTVTIRIRARYL